MADVMFRLHQTRLVVVDPELGYDVTLVKDAIGSFSWNEMKPTLELSAPHCARAIVSTEELMASIQTAKA